MPVQQQGSSKEEQINEKEQILAELQRVEKELQEKAHAQQQMPAKRNEPIGMEDPDATPPLTFQLPDQPDQPETPGIQGMTRVSLSSGCSLANIPPSERLKAKPSRKIDGKDAKQKSQLQAALLQQRQLATATAHMQRVEKELQEKAHAQQQMPAKRNEPIGMEDPDATPPLTFQLPDQPDQPETPGIQGMTRVSLSSGCSLANIPPSERLKAKPSRKIDGKDAKQKSQLQAALLQQRQLATATAHMEAEVDELLMVRKRSF